MFVVIVLCSELPDKQDKRMDEAKLFIELIQNALSQSSEQGASLLFTCPMLTAVSWAMYSGGCLLVVAACYVISKIESYHSSSKHSPFQCKLMEH